MPFTVYLRPSPFPLSPLPLFSQIRQDDHYGYSHQSEVRNPQPHLPSLHLTHLGEELAVLHDAM